MIKVIKFKISKNRNIFKKPVKETKPTVRDKYMQLLWDEGAGWKDDKLGR